MKLMSSAVRPVLAQAKMDYSASKPLGRLSFVQVRESRVGGPLLHDLLSLKVHVPK